MKWTTRGVSRDLHDKELILTADGKSTTSSDLQMPTSRL